MKKYQLKVNYTSLDNILIIDGKYLAYRSKYSKNQSGLNYKGIKTGLFFAFFNTLRSVIKKFLPVNVVIMWDSDSKKGIRKKEFLGYKVKESKTPLTEQELMELIEFENGYKELIEYCNLLGFASYYLEGYEADDLISLWVNRFTNCTNIIVTRDEDMYQCLRENVLIYDPDKKIKKDLKWFTKNYDITPEEWITVKAVGGCKSDKVPGVPGIGEKTAIDYIKNKTTTNANQKIHDAADDVILYYKLVTLPHHTLENYKLPFKKTKINRDTFFTFCQTFGFQKFINEITDFNLLMED